jgi:hypothetical protein
LAQQHNPPSAIVRMWWGLPNWSRVLPVVGGSLLAPMALLSISAPLPSEPAPDMAVPDTGEDPRTGSVVRLPSGTAPRGLRPDGMVRTTGWVQFGKLPVSSGFCAAQAAFLATAPLAPIASWLPVVAAPVGYLGWKLCITR